MGLSVDPADGAVSRLGDQGGVGQVDRAGCGPPTTAAQSFSALASSAYEAIVRAQVLHAVLLMNSSIRWVMSSLSGGSKRSAGGQNAITGRIGSYQALSHILGHVWPLSVNGSQSRETCLTIAPFRRTRKGLLSPRTSQFDSAAYPAKPLLKNRLGTSSRESCVALARYIGSHSRAWAFSRVNLTQRQKCPRGRGSRAAWSLGPNKSPG